MANQKEQVYTQRIIFCRKSTNNSLKVNKDNDLAQKSIHPQVLEAQQNHLYLFPERALEPAPLNLEIIIN